MHDFNSQWQFDRLFSCQSPFWLVVVESPVAQYGHVWFRPSGIHPLCRYTVAAAAAVQNKFWLWRFICTLLTKRRKSYINLLGHEKSIKILHFATWFYLRRFQNKILEYCKRIQLVLDIRGIDIRRFEYSRHPSLLVGSTQTLLVSLILLVKWNSRIRFSRGHPLTH